MKDKQRKAMFARFKSKRYYAKGCLGGKVARYGETLEGGKKTGKTYLGRPLYKKGGRYYIEEAASYNAVEVHPKRKLSTAERNIRFSRSKRYKDMTKTEKKMLEKAKEDALRRKVAGFLGERY